MAKGQTSIEGTERVKIEALEAAAEKFRGFTAEIRGLQAKQTEAKAELMEMMRKYKKDLPVNMDGDHIYRYDDPEGETRDAVLKHSEKESVHVIKVASE